MNQSKRKQTRWWITWFLRGSSKSIPFVANLIVVKDAHDAENDFEGGYDWKYTVIYCNVDEEMGTLEYETRGFPPVPNFSETPPSEAYVASIPRAGSITRVHVRTMQTLLWSEIEELREKGVRVEVRR